MTFGRNDMATDREIELLIKKMIHQEKQVIKYTVLTYTFSAIAAILIIVNIWGYGC